MSSAEPVNLFALYTFSETPNWSINFLHESTGERIKIESSALPTLELLVLNSLLPEVLSDISVCTITLDPIPASDSINDWARFLSFFIDLRFNLKFLSQRRPYELLEKLSERTASYSTVLNSTEMRKQNGYFEKQTFCSKPSEEKQRSWNENRFCDSRFL